MKPPYTEVVQELGLLNNLADFHPMIIGTPPLGIDVPDSDIDIACSAHELSSFVDVAAEYYGIKVGYSSTDIIAQKIPAVCVRFRSHGWKIELFCQAIPISTQWGVRHFHIEQRLLELEPTLKETIVELRQSGLKTEPAFAKILGLAGNPYEALLRLEERSDKELKSILRDKVG